MRRRFGMRWVLGTLCTVWALQAQAAPPEPVSDQEIKTFFASGHPLKCAVGQAAHMQGDHATALWIFRTCARENNLYGIMSLALFYELGLGVERSDEQAAALYRQAAHHPDHAGYGRNGKYYYALALLQGRGVAQDTQAGLSWMHEAARYGQEEALAYVAALAAATPAPPPASAAP